MKHKKQKHQRLVNQIIHWMTEAERRKRRQSATRRGYRAASPNR